MAKEAKKKKAAGDNGKLDPEATERLRLKKLAQSRNLLSSSPATDFSPLAPSKTVVKHHGKDILKKSQRKNRYLFCFNGLLAPISGGKIGELSNLGSKNPILYLDFPQGRMKLFGTIMYPKNRYLTLQFSRGGKNVVCEDCFDTMIVFSDAWWIGKKDENPNEEKIDFPSELYQNQGTNPEFDFQGGAGAEPIAGAGAGTGAARVKNHGSDKAVRKPAKVESLTDEDTEASSPEREEMITRSTEVTPVRHSERTAGKKFKFAEISSGENSPETDDEISEGEEDD